MVAKKDQEMVNKRGTLELGATKRIRDNKTSFVYISLGLLSFLPRIMEEGFVECALFYCFYEKMAYVIETLKRHLADFTSVSQLVSQNEKVHTRWGCVEELLC